MTDSLAMSRIESKTLRKGEKGTGNGDGSDMSTDTLS